MRPQSALLALLLVAIATIGVFAWLSLRTAPAAAHAPLAIGEAPAPASAQHSTPAPLANAPEPAAPTAPVERVERLATAEGNPAEDELGEALWIDGRIVLPENTPADERPVVIAEGRAFKTAKEFRARPDLQGRFRVAFAPGSKHGTLKLEARFLYLAQRVELKLAEPPREVVLEPLLGACLRGRVLGEGLSQELRARMVGTSVVARSPRPAGEQDLYRRVKLDAELGFELGGLAPQEPYGLSYDPGFVTPVWLPEMPVRIGELRELELHVKPGITLRGKVTDEHGQPVAGAAIQGWVSVEADGDTNGTQRQTKSAADGSFTLEGLPSGRPTFVVQRKGLKPVKEEIALASERPVEERTIVLARGASIAGTVAFGDGRPAAGARVSASEADVDWSEFNQSLTAVEVDAQGHFEITGLEDKHYHVYAQARDKSEPAEGEKPGRAKKGPTLRARVDDVEAGASAVALVLAEGLSFEARIVDDTGQPVARGAVGIWPKDERWKRKENQSRFFRDGQVRIEGLRTGSWQISASGKGLVDVERVIELPRDASGITITMVRTAKLSGVVLQPDGKIAVGAQVAVFENAQDANNGPWAWNGAKETDNQGRFALDEIPAGKRHVLARMQGFAPGPSVELELAPGQERAGLQLLLRTGASIDGVLHASIEPREMRRVTLENTTAKERSAYTDAEGRFRFEGLPAGKLVVVLEPTVEQQKSMGGEAGRDWELREGLRRRTPVELAENQQLSLVLGAPSASVVRVQGVVRKGARGLARARVTAHFSGQNDGSNAQLVALADEDGRYELELPRGGNWMLQASRTAQGTRVIQHLEVPASGALRVDFELPSGGIAGKVVGADGKGLQQINVQLQGSDADADRAQRDRRSSSWGNVTTEEDGSFHFDDLGKGRYTLTAHDWGWNRSDKYATAYVRDLALAENQQLDGLVVEMKAPGMLEVHLFDAAGQPLVGTGFSVLDERGNQLAWDQTEDGGKKLVGGLEPGNYRVQAQDDEWLLPEPAQAEVRVGVKSVVEARLVRGLRMRLRIRDQDKQTIGARLEIQDAAGQLVFQFGAQPEDVVDVPKLLLPGRYTVISHNDGGENGRVQVELEQSPVPVVELTVRR